MSLKILIGDDAPFIRDLIRNIVLTDAHHTILEAENGHEVCTLALQEKPDLIFLDLAMPHRNGIDAAQLILEKDPQMPIYIISSLHEEYMVQKAIEVGCRDFIAKPFEVHDILSVVKMHSKKGVVNE